MNVGDNDRVTSLKRAARALGLMLTQDPQGPDAERWYLVDPIKNTIVSHQHGITLDEVEYLLTSANARDSDLRRHLDGG